MHFCRLFCASICCCTTLTLAQQEVAATTKPTVEVTSYAVGVDMARNFKKQDVAISPEMLIKGLNDGLAGGKIDLSEKELRRVMNSFQSEVRQKMTVNRRLAAEENRRRGQIFLEENKTRQGVIALASGLQYRVIKLGAGRRPLESDLVECLYRGALLNGTEFDATEPGKPATLKVSALIAGWKEALKLMPEGSKWELFIPSSLAYSERGVGSDIGPNETLIFELELLAIK